MAPDILLNTGLTALTIACIVCSADAVWATQPTIACSDLVYEGVNACVVQLQSYSFDPGTGRPRCPAAAFPAGQGTICEEVFAAAISDAKVFFAAAVNDARTYVIQVPAGNFDFSGESTPLAGLRGAIDVSGIKPAGTGCLSGSPAATGVVALSGSGCLVIGGNDVIGTTLVTADGMAAIYGMGTYHLVVENLTMEQPNLTTTQGFYVSQGLTDLQGIKFPTLTLDILPGFPTPLDLFVWNCKANGPLGCTQAGLATVPNAVYARAYTDGSAPQLILSPAAKDINAQLAFGFPTHQSARLAMVAPYRADPVHAPQRWTLVSSVPAATRALPTVYSQTTGGLPNLICMKIDSGQAFWFDSPGYQGGDIIFNQMTWSGASRGTFRHLTASANNTWLAGQVYHSAIRRGVGGGCLSTQAGGLQFGQPQDGPIFGNVVYDLWADATGDDTIAVFNDVGGTRMPNGSVYPQTVIENSNISNSFARNIILYNDHVFSGIRGNSPVLVDEVTQQNIVDHGNCDPLIFPDCPVIYVSQ